MCHMEYQCGTIDEVQGDVHRQDNEGVSNDEYWRYR